MLTWYQLASGHTGFHVDLESHSAGKLGQVAMTQTLVVVDTLAGPGALPLLPSVWLHSWAQEPALYTWEGGVVPILASWGLMSNTVSSSGVRDASCQSSKGSSSMASRKASSANHIRLVIHSQKSLAVAHIT